MSVTLIDPYRFATFDSDYELISTTVLGTTASSVTFSSIPSDYKHLQIRMVARANSAALNLFVRFNSSTTGYAWHYLEGNGSAVNSGAGSTQSRMILGVIAQAANRFSPSIMDILDYANTSKNTTVRQLSGADNSSNVWVGLHSGFWNNTNAITDIELTAGTSDSFVSGSRFSLYGIRG